MVPALKSSRSRRYYRAVSRAGARRDDAGGSAGGSASASGVAFLLPADGPRADGAFPDSMQIFVPADHPHRIILATNFGLIISEDDGATWEWTCEPICNDNDDPLPEGAPLRRSGCSRSLISHGLVYSDDLACSWTAVGRRALDGDRARRLRRSDVRRAGCSPSPSSRPTRRSRRRCSAPTTAASPSDRRCSPARPAATCWGSRTRSAIPRRSTWRCTAARRQPAGARPDARAVEGRWRDAGPPSTSRRRSARPPFASSPSIPPIRAASILRVTEKRGREAGGVDRRRADLQPSRSPSAIS